ncbi:MAG TPA: PilZ domain-containing protein [Pyrinomonadaceae bacterium]|nr:PilZ domain-containing protein [Pyrinomonadaceae bacterium]
MGRLNHFSYLMPVDASIKEFPGVGSLQAKVADRRRAVRREVSFSARWQGLAPNCMARISDLSEDGCYVDTVARVSVGEILGLTISLTQEKNVTVQALVAHWTPQLGFGLKFLALTEKQQDELRGLSGENDD